MTTATMPSQLVPAAIAFRDRRTGLLGTGWKGARGTIQATSDGGRTWHVVLRTPARVAAIGYDAGGEWARLADGSTLRSRDGIRWRRGVPERPPPSPCRSPLPGRAGGARAGRSLWAVCTGGAGAGAMQKAVERSDDGGRHWRTIAASTLPGSGGRRIGRISIFGYPLGIAMAADGFGLIWADRSTLLVTRDGGVEWTGVPSLVRPDVDFARSAVALGGGFGLVLFSSGGGPRGFRLATTTDRGRTWRIVHRWP